MNFPKPPAEFSFLSCSVCQKEIDPNSFYACISESHYAHMACAQKVRATKDRTVLQHSRFKTMNPKLTFSEI